MAQGKKNRSKREMRKIRIQQIIFGAVAIIVILSWIITLIAN